MDGANHHVSLGYNIIFESRQHHRRTAVIVVIQSTAVSNSEATIMVTFFSLDSQA